MSGTRHTRAPATGSDLALAEAIRLVMTAGSGQELFGTPQPARHYRRLARALHPDRLLASGHRCADPRCVPGSAGPGCAERVAATEAFLRLTQLWRDSRRAADPRVTDTGPHHTGGAGEPGGTRDAGGVRLGRYRAGALRYHGDLADLYDIGADRLLKLPRDPANNDLMAREARALRTLAERGDPRYLPYVPRLVDSFRHRDSATGVQCQVNVVAAAPGLYSLREVHDAYPGGVDGRDAAWMWRRLLVALGFAHRAGVVHGAVLPGHVLIEPDAHGLVLVDWCYATDGDGDRVPALVPEYAAWYPAEVPDREAAGPGTDIAMAARCMAHLMGPRIPAPLRAFAAGCTLPARCQRPDDAWHLLAELDEVLGRLYGPRRFRPFHL